MIDLDIMDRNGETVMWRYKGIDGTSIIRDEKAVDAMLCEGDMLLTKGASEEIQRLVTEWIPTHEQARLEFATWEEKHEKVQTAWDRWQEEQEYPIKFAIPSVDDLPTDTAVAGMCILVDYDEDGRPHMTEILMNPTWGEVLYHFDLCIRFTGDEHHCFLEGLYEVETEERPAGVLDDIPVYRFSTGS